MTRVLVTGASGFVGSHVCDVLVARGHTVIGTHHPTQAAPGGKINWAPWDLADDAGFAALLREHRPAHLYHLASPAHVPSAGKDPMATIDAILGSAVRLLDAVRAAASVERMIYASSAEVYAAPASDLPLDEDAKVEPRSIYGICKSAASQWLLSQAPELVTVLRPFNQIGPRQSPLFAVASFAEQLARIKRKAMEPVLHVGNLDVERDFSDVRDTALAHVLALEKGAAGAVYNVASGVPTRLRDLLDAMIAQLGEQVSVHVDPTRVRANDIPRIVGNANALRAATGWAPKSNAKAAALAALDHALKTVS